jgi:hypothetical protein
MKQTYQEHIVHALVELRGCWRNNIRIGLVQHRFEGHFVETSMGFVAVVAIEMLAYKVTLLRLKMARYFLFEHRLDLADIGSEVVAVGYNRNQDLFAQ